MENKKLNRIIRELSNDMYTLEEGYTALIKRLRKDEQQTAKELIQAYLSDAEDLLTYAKDLIATKCQGIDSAIIEPTFYLTRQLALARMLQVKNNR